MENSKTLISQSAYDALENKEGKYSSERMIHHWINGEGMGQIESWKTARPSLASLHMMH